MNIPVEISTGTAAGPQSMPTFVIDLNFRVPLSPFYNLQDTVNKLSK
jgi:hypothetical protein